MKRTGVIGAAWCAGLLFAGGCMSLARYDVRLRVEPDMKSANGRYPPVEVHLVVLDTAASADLAQRDLGAYWKPGRRNDAYEAQKAPFYFGEEKPFEQLFSKEDPRWKAWKKIEDPKLWVIADLPGVSGGGEDPRRRCVPLARTHWRWLWSQRLDVSLSREKGIRVTVPEGPTP